MRFLGMFRKEEKSNAIKIGDWVTQYSAGYWKVIDIVPKYADEDYSYEGKTWKKGDRLGDWAILKKGLTAKMKPGNACEFVDAQWCKPVSDEIAQAIEAVFAENGKAKQKFDNAPNLPKPSVASVWMRLTEEQATSFADTLTALPERFALEQFWEQAANYRQFVVDPSKATHIVYLYSYLWEIDDHFEPLHFGTEIKKL